MSQIGLSYFIGAHGKRLGVIVEWRSLITGGKPPLVIDGTQTQALPDIHVLVSLNCSYCTCCMLFDPQTYFCLLVVFVYCLYATSIQPPPRWNIWI